MKKQFLSRLKQYCFVTVFLIPGMVAAQSPLVKQRDLPPPNFDTATVTETIFDTTFAIKNENRKPVKRNITTIKYYPSIYEV